MAISFKEQIDNFSNDFYINTAYIPYIVNGPECADGLSADELKRLMTSSINGHMSIVRRQCSIHRTSVNAVSAVCKQR